MNYREPWRDVELAELVRRVEALEAKPRPRQKMTGTQEGLVTFGSMFFGTGAVTAAVGLLVSIAGGGPHLIVTWSLALVVSLAVLVPCLVALWRRG